MNKAELSKHTYILLWLNSATSTLMAQYMMYGGFFPIIYLFPWICSAIGYRYGYLYATQGREVPRKTYLILLAVYTGIFALPPISRVFWFNFHPILFSYACGRLLMFRAVWLTKRFEAYLHLLLYSAIVFSCMAHERADFTLLVFLPLHIIVLVCALYSLYRDGQRKLTGGLPIIPLLQGLIAVIFFSVLLSVLLPATKIWDFQLIPDKVGKISLSKEGDAVDRAMEYLMSKGGTANPESGLGDWLLQKMQMMYAYYQEIQRYVGYLEIDLLFLIWWIIICVFLLFLWMARHHLFLMIMTLLIDPVRISYIADKDKVSKKDVLFLYRAYERLWAYKGIAREKSMTPVEHLVSIAKVSRDMVKPSLKITTTFQAVRYGDKKLSDLTNEIKEYLLLRATVHPNIETLFDKRFIDKK